MKAHKSVLRDESQAPHFFSYNSWAAEYLEQSALYSCIKQFTYTHHGHKRCADIELSIMSMDCYFSLKGKTYNGFGVQVLSKFHLDQSFLVAISEIMAELFLGKIGKTSSKCAKGVVMKML